MEPGDYIMIYARKLAPFIHAEFFFVQSHHTHASSDTARARVRSVTFNYLIYHIFPALVLFKYLYQRPTSNRRSRGRWETGDLHTAMPTHHIRMETGNFEKPPSSAARLFCFTKRRKTMGNTLAALSRISRQSNISRPRARACDERHWLIGVTSTLSLASAKPWASSRAGS